MSGVLTPSGTKGEDDGLLYLHVEKDGGYMACGKYMLDASALKPIREKIVEEPKVFASVLASLKKADL